jgi:hemoglobin/transferrin/lactoferrin receptor protein
MARLRRTLLSATALALLPFAAGAQNAATPLDAVVSTATRTQTIAGDAATSVSVVDREEIDRRQPQSIDDLLKDMPGVDANGVPRNTVKQVTIRGLSDERVVMRLDGVRNNFSAGHRGRIFLDPDLLKQVEVVRGPGSLLFGSGALGGAIGLRTVDAEDVLKPGAATGGRLKAGYQTNNAQRMASATAAAKAQGFDIVANVTGRTSGNFTDGRRTEIPWSGDDIVSGMLKGGYDIAPGHRVGFSTIKFRDNHTIPLDANLGNATANSTIVDRVTQQNSYAVNWAYASPSNRALDAKLVVYRNEIDIQENRVLPVAAARNDTTALATNGFDVQNTARFGLADLGAHALTFGADGYMDAQESKRNGALRGDYPKAEQSVYGLFVQDEIEFGRWVTLTPGVRFDSFSQSALNNVSRDVTHVSPKGSIAVHVTPWLSPYLSYAEAFRVPSLTELYVNGQHFPGNNFVPNPNLRPETAENKEAGANLKFSDVVLPGDRLRGRAAYFVNDISDYIQQVVGTTTTTSTNVSAARISGAEVEIQYDARSWFASTGATRLRGDNRATGAPLADTPADKVSFSLGRRFLDSGVTLGARAVASAAQTRVPSGTPQTGGYAVWDVFASWQPTDEALKDFRVDLAVDNLFDKVYRRSNWNSATPAPFYEVGRNAKLAVSWRF